MVSLSVCARNVLDTTNFFPIMNREEVRAEGRDALELVLAAINTSQAELRELRDEVRGAQEDTAVKLVALRSERAF